MEIKLNIYQRGFEGQKSGRVFEPQIWHRIEFLQKNFIRFFGPGYLVDELYVEVTPTSSKLDAFEFKFNGSLIRVDPFINTY